MNRIERIAKSLTPAERKAIMEARHSKVFGTLLVRRFNDDEALSIRTRAPVMASLVEKGLLSRKVGMPLVKLGLEVRDYLLAKEGI